LTRYFARDAHELRLSVSALVWRDRERQELLLMQRSDNRCWGLPGGYVEPGESVTAAAEREVYEETGVRIAVGRLAGVYSDPARQVVEYPDGQRVQAVNLCFEGYPCDAHVDPPTTPAETLATGYFPVDALPDPLVPIHRIRIEDVLRGDGITRVR